MLDKSKEEVNLIEKSKHVKEDRKSYERERG